MPLIILGIIASILKMSAGLLKLTGLSFGEIVEDIEETGKEIGKQTNKALNIGMIFSVAILIGVLIYGFKTVKSG